MNISKVFQNGNSQAVRIPAELRLETDTVQVYKNQDGDLVIHPIYATRGQRLQALLRGFDAEFIQALESDRQEIHPPQDRPDW